MKLIVEILCSLYEFIRCDKINYKFETTETGESFLGFVFCLQGKVAVTSSLFFIIINFYTFGSIDP